MNLTKRAEEARDRGGYRHFETERINITVWTKLRKMEIYTRRGQSFCAEGEEAIAFAEWLRDNLVQPILEAK